MPIKKKIYDFFTMNFVVFSNYFICLGRDDIVLDMMRNDMYFLLTF